MSVSLPSAAEIASRRRRGLELRRAERPAAATVALLATFNVELLPPFLAEACERVGLDVDVHVPVYGQVEQAILDPASPLYALAPDAVVLVPAADDLLDGADGTAAERVRSLESLCGALLERLPGVPCYVVVFGSDRVARPNVLDPLAPARGQAEVEQFVHGVRALSRLSPRLVVVDWDWQVRSIGLDAVRDERLWYLARMRLNPAGNAVLADLLARHVASYHGRGRKVLAFDLDGTVWGGVVGEVGVGGIDCGNEGVGLAYQDFQRQLLRLRETGVLLAACSKNNPEDAWEVFDRHPAMVLRREHLTADRIDWRDKATNLREIAAELGLGLDSFVFVDDNPVERAWVAEALPEVLVPDVPEDPTERPAWLAQAPWFDRVAVTESDARRAEGYREQRERGELRQRTTSLDAFLAQLEQRVDVEPFDEASLARAAQLCQRTNQFNLTTKRYTAADIEAFAAADDHDVLTVSVSDRFGDSGLTGLVVLRHEPDETVIDTFLLSCRVLGRRVEDIVLDHVVALARGRGSRRVVGCHVPTPKNVQVADFYAARGFEDKGGGVFVYELAEVPSNA